MQLNRLLSESDGTERASGGGSLWETSDEGASEHDPALLSTAQHVQPSLWLSAFERRSNQCIRQQAKTSSPLPPQLNCALPT